MEKYQEVIPRLGPKSTYNPVFEKCNKKSNRLIFEMQYLMVYSFN